MENQEQHSKQLRTAACTVLREMKMLASTPEAAAVVFPSSSSSSSSPSLPTNSSAYITMLCNQLKNIAESMRILSDIDTGGKRSPTIVHVSENSKPPVPLAIISIMQLRAVYTALEVIWVASLRSYVVNASGSSISIKDIPSAMLLDRAKFHEIGDSPNRCKFTLEEILEFVETCYEVCQVNSFSNMMLERNMGRILVCLFLLSEASSEVLISKTKKLLSLITTNKNKVVVVRGLRSLFRGSSSLRTRAIKVLTTLLLESGGLGAVLQAQLEHLDESNSEAQQGVAKLVTSVPRGMNKVDFFRNIVDQLVSFYKGSLVADDKVACRVCSLVVNKICTLCISEGYRMVQLILKPLLAIHDTNNDEISKNQADLHSLLLVHDESATGESVQGDVIPRNDLICNERQVEMSVGVIHHVMTSTAASPAFLKCIVLSKGGRTMIWLLEYLKTNLKSSSLLQVVEEFVYTYWDNLGAEISMREVFATFFSHRHIKYGLEMEKDIVDVDCSWNPCNVFSGGSSGGVEVLRKKEGHDDKNPQFDVESVSALLGGALGLSQSLSGNDDFTNFSYQMLDLSNRSEMFTEILVSYDKGAAGKNALQSSASHDRSLSSSVFLTILKEFIGGSDYGSIFQDQERLNQNLEDLSPEVDPQASRSVYGMVLLTLQEKIPFEFLLKNGLHIFLLLQSFITSRAKVLRSIQNNGTDNLSSSTFVFDCDGEEDNFEHEESSKDNTPLIVEISDEEGIKSKPLSNYNEGKTQKNENQDAREEEVSGNSIILTSLALLSAILSMGNISRTPDEEKILHGLLDPLQVISSLERNEEVSQAAADVALALITRSATPRDEKTCDKESRRHDDNHSPFQKVIEENREYLSKSDDPAMRGLGVRNIIITLREAVFPLDRSDRQLARSVLLDLLKDPESFVYLNVVHAIGRLADINRAELVPTLLDVYTGERSESIPNNQYRSVHERAILSEALMMIIRRAGETANLYVSDYIRACIKVFREESKILRTAENLDNDRTENMDNNDLSSHHLLRQSSISLLAETCAMAGWSAGKLLFQALDIAQGILQLENPAISSAKYQKYRESSLSFNSKYSIHTSRRAAAYLIRYILNSIKHKLCLDLIYEIDEYLPKIRALLDSVSSYESRKVLIGGEMKDVYEDKVVLFHCRRALGALDDIVPQLQTYSTKRGNQLI